MRLDDLAHNQGVDTIDLGELGQGQRRGRLILARFDVELGDSGQPALVERLLLPEKLVSVLDRGVANRPASGDHLRDEQAHPLVMGVRPVSEQGPRIDQTAGARVLGLCLFSHR